MHKTKVFAMAVLGTLTFSACATKGFVRNGLAEQGAALRTEFQGGLAGEKQAREAADEALRADLAALRTELQSLRTDFGARISAVEGQVKFAMPVHFAFDDASVREQDRAALERFAAVARKYYAGSQITIEGFADPAGSAAYNLRLSQQRADAVRDLLTSQGLDGGLLKTVGYGKTRLVRPGAQGDDPGAELNRRVVFVVETPSETTVAALSMR